jgi:hypothetical protein
MEKGEIIKVLEKFNFVNWDRYFGEAENLTFFGWIDREDNKKDFLVLDFSLNPLWFATSSKIYSKKISEILGVNHSDCKRVEDFCDIQNMIKLNKSHSH